MKGRDLRKLQIPRTLYDAGTVTVAAAALRMTPSGVSQQLSALSE
jgi:DNA-binding transcriptional LysR family regulator